MTPLNPRLQKLVELLDDLGPEITLAAIAEALAATALRPDDVADFVRENPISYQRNRVVRRGHYELLILTWLPGQSSLPHDHTGSICALQVLQGEGIEGEYTVAVDGYAELEYETRLETGQISGGQDAGIHTIRNPSATETLVTVHIYAPPLRDVRRFAIRPQMTARPVKSHIPTVAILGGGFSGAMTAAHLLRQGSDLRILLVERRGTVGEGVAYGTQEVEHLLNVPAARMSAWPDQPGDFLEWAQRRDASVRPSDFLPRRWYGDYLGETLRHSIQGSDCRLEVVLQEARRVARHPSGGWMVHLDQSSPVRADAVVVAIGHRPPSDPLRKIWTGSRERFLGDPWQPFAVSTVPPDESVAILGSGLTALDTILSLIALPRTAPITLISRSGLLPHSHSATPVPALDLSSFVEKLLESPGELRASQLSKAVHRRAREHMAEGGNWRAVVDGLRPFTAKIWQALSESERLRFIARIRPFWEVHRHRMAPQIAERLRQLQEQGLVRLRPGQIVSAKATENRVQLDTRTRGSETTTTETYDWVINCTGPAPSNRAEANPVIGSLLVHGWVRRDTLSLGLDVTASGQAIAANGAAMPDLFVVGTLRKPLLWESTAVPELRQQAAQVAEKILARFPPVARI